MDEVCQPVNQDYGIKMEYVEKYSVSIETLDLGFVVRVGCKSFAFTNKKEMLEKLIGYFENPSEKQKQYQSTGTI